MTSAIHPYSPLEITLDVCRLRSTRFNVLLFKKSQEMTGNINVPLCGSRSIPLVFQVIFESCKPHFVVGMLI